MKRGNNIVGWKCWYTDGVLYSSREHSWAALPDSGVQVVVIYLEQQYALGLNYRQILTGKDWYYWENGEIKGVPSVSWDGVWVDPPKVSPENIKKGTASDCLSYNLIMKMAREAKSWA